MQNFCLKIVWSSSVYLYIFSIISFSILQFVLLLGIMSYFLVWQIVLCQLTRQFKSVIIENALEQPCLYTSDCRLFSLTAIVILPPGKFPDFFCRAFWLFYVDLHLHPGLLIEIKLELLFFSVWFLYYSEGTEKRQCVCGRMLN